MIRKATLLAALSAALLAPLVAAAPSPAAAKQGAAAAVTGRQSVSLSISSITPDVPKSVTDQIKFSGTVRNDTGTPLSNVYIRLRYDAQPFTDRVTMAAYQADQNQATLPRNVSSKSSMIIPSVPAGSSVRWEFIATPPQLGYRTFGVYPVAVEVAPNNAISLFTQRTYLTYAPPTVPKRPVNKLAVALPVIDQPHRATDDTFVDDKLSQALTGKGRLADLANLAQSAPSSVTWVMEPSLLEDLQKMSAGKYTVQVKDDKQVKPASAEAGQWLTNMRTALASAPVVATPYADPDVAALAHQGLDSQTRRAIDLGGQTARSLISRNAKTNVYWPAAGVLDADALDLLSVSKVDRVLLNSTNLPPQTPATATPDAASTLDSVNGPVTALTADAELSRLFEPQAGTSTLLSTQRFIAETAMISAEPGQILPRSLVIAPSRRWDPNPTLVAALLKAANRLPWLRLTPLESIKPSKASVPRAGLTYTEQDRKEELSGKYLEPVKNAWSEAQLTALITGRTESSFDAAVLRLTSSGWRNGTRAGRSVTKTVGEAVSARTNEILITGSGPDRPRTLAGSNGVVPISVKNSLSTPIALYIDVKSNNPELLQVTYRQDEPLKIGGKQIGTVRVPMNAAPDVSGDATVTVQLKTSDGRPYGKPQRLTIRTTGYTGIALVIVGAALTVMLAAVVLRVLRRRSERKLARAAKSRESETV
ncbi:hypothetical protein SAMN05444920_104608 [Nonomuraea solani]|uniref:Glycoprotein n=1 Tax=Nonomuraea solani TaxID=1144553 RepID=A0A1H6D0B9_9ACTN|nr:DUF6049 family protein [Nonomuraea solani]SEG78484.1 hypothetical protein SAMN05444920_104608 [Nonomuraea solani]